jgi:hypothetical protein
LWPRFAANSPRVAPETSLGLDIVSHENRETSLWDSAIGRTGVKTNRLRMSKDDVAISHMQAKPVVMITISYSEEAIQLLGKENI